VELEAGDETDPEVVFTDPRREHGWRVAMEKGPEPEKWWAEILLPREPTLLRYHFELGDGSLIRERRQKEGIEKPLFGVWEEQDFQIAVYLPEDPPPAWVRGQVVCQIFPDRFARGGNPDHRSKSRSYEYKVIELDWGQQPEHPPKGRDFYGGNLRGVIEKLDYLVDLGVTCLYFTPIFASPTNHRYDALDYTKIDPRLGTDEDLQELIHKCRELGMRVLLDGVFNHCSSESIYFKSARADRCSPYYRWFNFKHWPDEWTCWVGVKTMPEFVECPEVEDFFFGDHGIAQYWLSYGTAGWRTDVTLWMTDEFWRRFRRAVRRSDPEVYLVAEDWGNASHHLLGDSFDATMNYRFAYSVVGFAGGKLTSAELDDRLETLRRDTPPASFHAQLNLIDSHDTPRALSVLEGDKQRLMLATAIQLAYPGVPMIYSGDEVGVEGAYAEDSRRSFPWEDPDVALLDFYRRAIHARRKNIALSQGEVATAWIDERGGYGFFRQAGEDVVLALFNNSDSPVEALVPIGKQGYQGNWGDLLGGLPEAAIKEGILCTILPAKGFAWYYPNNSR
jgi:glycosidase